MKEFELKYGCNPNQKPARIFMEDGSELPVEILSGRPGYINFLDALNSWQLVKEIKDALGMCAATSFKHVSPTSAAVGLPMTEKQKKAFFVDDIEGLDESPIATAYARARGTDRMSSFGDWIALSDKCDVTCAKLIKREVSDGVIAPGYDPEALEILKTKRKGNYNIIKIDPSYVPAQLEKKQVFGVTFEQRRNDYRIDTSLFSDMKIIRELYRPDVMAVGISAIEKIYPCEMNPREAAYATQWIGPNVVIPTHYEPGAPELEDYIRYAQVTAPKTIVQAQIEKTWEYVPFQVLG